MEIMKGRDMSDNKFQISVSILTADFCELGALVDEIEKSDIEMLHFDVMDGMFVQNISFGIPVLKSVRKRTNKILDVHLMIEQPERYIEAFAEAGADIITVHAESCKHLHRVLQMIKKAGKKAGVALNPATDLKVLDWVYDDLDMVLLMSVNPGFGGQSYIDVIDKKLKELKARTAQYDHNIDIEVDGGVNEKTLDRVVSNGANVIVMGSALLNGEPLEDRVKQLRP